jgi:exodeoxyribonuclease VII large subunit
MQDKAKIYTVSQVNTLIKGILQNQLPARLIIAGQISDWRHHQSGHCYFLLKDDGAQLPCVMWSSNFYDVRFKVENGLAVIAEGYVDVYVPGGKYQFYAESMQPQGIGALQLAFEQMVKKLQAQGLFDEAHKKPLPPYPERIGILTSESGAALSDITKSIFDRWPPVKLLFYPVPVQGEGAAEKIAAAIRDINRRNRQLKIDVLIVGRGGGSMEDLWAFNEEVLAKAIYGSKVPVISAVGHEIDTTIADLVADKRASTPTKAGVVAVPDMKDVLKQLTGFEANLRSKTRWQLQLYEKTLQTILASAVFKNPLLAVYNRQQDIDEFGLKLTDALRELLADAKSRLHNCYENIVKIEPHRLLSRKVVEMSNLQNRSAAAVNAVINKCRLNLTAAENRLTAMNPKAVLKRGYSITTSPKTGLLVRSSADVQLGNLLITELADENLIESKVTKK